VTVARNDLKLAIAYLQHSSVVKSGITVNCLKLIASPQYIASGPLFVMPCLVTSKSVDGVAGVTACISICRLHLLYGHHVFTKGLTTISDLFFDSNSSSLSRIPRIFHQYSRSNFLTSAPYNRQ